MTLAGELRLRAKQLPWLVSTVRAFRRLLRLRSLIQRRELFRQRQIDAYLSQSGVRKLHLGAGTHVLAGWLNSDIAPEVDGVLFLDATKRMPFADASFDYIYSEHMIEHVPYASGVALLKEARRVLKPNGRLRIATPSLDVLVGLFSPPLSDLQRRFISWEVDTWVGHSNGYRAAFVLNNEFRNYGHQFLYDAETLEATLSECGFVDVVRCPVGESDDAHLRELEGHGRAVQNEEMVRFGTMVYEARRPRETEI